MAILHFKEGLQASLSGVAFDKGAVYITSDTKKLYVDLPDGSSVGTDRICLGDFQLVEYSSGTAAAALDKCTIKEPNVLYVTSNATDGHQLWRYNGTAFISLSSTNDVAVLKADVAQLKTDITKKAPTEHASSDVTYGKGDKDKYGHLKLSDATDDDKSGVDAGVAATPKAVNAALTAAKTHANNIKTELLGSSSSTGGNTIYEAYAKASAASTAAATAQKEVDALEGVVSNLTTTVNGKAPTVHTSDSGSTYGAASTSVYGHTKLNSSITSDSEILAATPKAVKLAIADAKAYTDTKDSALRTAIDNLSNLMNFVGTTTSEINDGVTTTINKPSTVASDATYTAKAGDVVIDSKGKECVYDGSVWRLIGDTSALTTAVTNLQNTVGTKPSSPSMDNKLWDEVADLRTELGEKGDTANSATTASAFARLNAHDATLATHATNITNNKTSIDNIVLTLTWGSF